MNFALKRPDRYPTGTTVSVYHRSAYQPGRAPTGPVVTTAVMDDDSGAVFLGLDEGASYSAYALVDGHHRYVQFQASSRSERSPSSGDVANWDVSSGKLAYRNPRFVDALADGFGLVEGEDVSAYDGQVNVAAYQNFLDAAALIGEGYIGPTTIVLYGTARRPGGLDLYGAGRGLTKILSHPDYAVNGPIITNQINDDGDYLPVSGYEHGITYDGQYLNNTDFNTRCTVTVEAASTDTTWTVNSTAGFSAAGRLSFVASGDNVSRATYTSKDDTHFYGIAWQIDEDHSAATVPVDTELRKFDSSVNGLVRFYNIDGLHFDDCEFMRSASYPLSGGGRPYDSDESQRPKRYLRLTFCRIHDSYDSDGLDVKDIESFFASQTEITDCYDKGYNVRGRYLMIENGVTKRNRTGYGLTSSPSVDSSDRHILPLQSTITKTSTTITVSSTAGLATTGYGWIGNTERVSYTVTNSTTLTIVRGLRSTEPAAHLSGTNFIAEWDLETYRGTIDLFGCHADSDNTGMTLAAGGSYTRANVYGGTIKGCRLGLAAVGVLGPMEISVHGTSIYANQIGMKATRCVYVGLFDAKIRSSTGNSPSDPGSDADGSALILEDCSNRTEIHGCDLSANAGWGLQTIGTTDHIEWNGRPPKGNGLGPWSLATKTVDTTGTLFGAPAADFIPRFVQETVPIREAKDKLTMVSGTVFVAPIRAKGMMRGTTLTTYVTDTTDQPPTAVKLALVELSGTNGLTFAKLAQTATYSGSGPLGNTGFKNNLVLENSGKWWLEPGKLYGIAILWVGTGTAPKLAALTPVAVDALSSYRPLLAGTVAASSNDIPASGTLTPTTTVPYLGVANGG